jgi:NADPH:quinone reductase
MAEGVQRVVGSGPALALRFGAFGGPEALEVVPMPAVATNPGPGEAVVAVRAASVNPSDVKNLAGRMRQTVPPRIPGRDFAGTVVAGPPAWLGRAVWGTGGDIGFTRDGSHAGLLRLPVAALAEKPAALSFEEAGAVGVNYVTALLGLDYAGLRAGETVAVLGASGGVGGAVCVLAKALGARVLACQRGAPAPDAPARRVADAFVDLAAGPPAEAIAAAAGGAGIDLVYDCVGTPPLFEAALGLLAPRGRLVAIAGSPGERVGLELIPFYRRELRLIGVDSLKRTAADCAPLMERLRPGFESGAYPPPALAHRFALRQGREAYAMVGAGTRGRVVLTMADGAA